MPFKEDATETDVSESQRDNTTVVTFSEAIVDAKQFGEKTIGFWAGLCLLINNVTGPGMVQMPQVAATSGIVWTTLVTVLSCVLAGFASTMMLEAIKRMPGNSKFEQRIEFTTLAKYFFRGQLRWAYYATLIFFMLSFQTTLISSVIESSQTTDSAFIEIFGKTCGLQFYGTNSDSDAPALHTPNDAAPFDSDVDNSFGWRCVSDGASTSDSPFGDAWVISMGFVFVLLLALPAGYFNLDDNIWVQQIGCGLLVVIFTEWCIQSFIRGIVLEPSDSQRADGFGGMPWFSSDLKDVFGMVLFNFAYVTTLPSWVNEKKSGVPVNESIWWSSLVGTTMFLVIAVLCAGAFDFTGDSDLLAVLTSSSTRGCTTLTRVMTYLFPWAALVTSIPIMSIIIRYNLLENNLCNTFWANIWGGVFPYIMSLVLYTGSALNFVVTWSGMLIVVPLNFALPAYFYICALRSDNEPSEDGENGPLLEDAPPTHSKHEVREDWAVGETVDVWVPGQQWLPCVVIARREEELEDTDLRDAEALNGTSEKHPQPGQTAVVFTVRSVDESLSPCDVVASNVRAHDPANHAHGRGQGAGAKIDIPQSKTQQKLTALQARLDRYEQEMGELRKEIAVFVIEFSGDSEQQRLKKLHQREMVRLQRKVDRVIQKMEDVRAEADGDDTHLTSAQLDELFSALPPTWSVATRINAAWVVLGLSVVLNIVALAYKIAG